MKVDLKALYPNRSRTGNSKGKADIVSGPAAKESLQCSDPILWLSLREVVPLRTLLL